MKSSSRLLFITTGVVAAGTGIALLLSTHSPKESIPAAPAPVATTATPITPQTAPADTSAKGSRAELVTALRAKLGPAATADEIMAALLKAAGSDTSLAIELAHALGRNEDEKAMWVSDLAQQWAKREPQQAWDWMSKQEKRHLSDLAAGTVPEVMIAAMAQQHPALLLRKVDQLVRTGEGPVGVAPVVAVHIGLEALAASQQLDAARSSVEAWARDPAKLAIGEAAYVVVANAMAKAARPEDAAQWILSLPRSDDRDTALVEYPGHWSQSDPRGALAWIEQSLPAELRDTAVRRTFNDWTERSSAEAAEWLGTYLTRASAGVETDRLIGAVINLGSVVKSNPALGLQWTGLLSTEATRTAYEEKVVLRWARQDEPAATAYLTKSTTLTPARKQAILQKMASPTFRETES